MIIKTQKHNCCRFSMLENRMSQLYLLALSILVSISYIVAKLVVLSYKYSCLPKELQESILKYKRDSSGRKLNKLQV